MLYQIAMFWDGSHSDSRAVAESCGESTHWVTVNGKDAAKTTIFVQNANDAADLAELINKLTARPLDPRKIDYRIKMHTNASQICEGVYPEGTSRAEVEDRVRGTFGGRFESFGDGRFRYVAYTD